MTEKKIDIRDYIEIIDDAKSGSTNNFFSNAIINDKQTMKWVTDNTLKTINANVQKQMIADMGNVFNDSALCKKIIAYFWYAIKISHGKTLVTISDLSMLKLKIV